MQFWTPLRIALGYGIPIRALMLFFDTLARQLESGRTIGDALVDSGACSGDSELHGICMNVAPSVQRGMSLHAVLQPYARRFPEIVLPLLEVGELAGALPDSARRLGAAFGESVSADRRMKMNAYDPRLALLALCLIKAIFVIVRGLGAFARNQTPAQMAVSVAEQTAIFAAELVLAYHLLRLVFRALYRWQVIREWVDTVKLALPMLGPVSRNLSLARWARSFAVLWGAGINIARGLEVSSRSALNAHYERALRAAAQATRHGRPLSDTLAATQLLSPMLLNVIRTSETVGRMDDTLLSLAGEMEREALVQAELAMNKIVQAGQLVIFLFAVVWGLSQLS